jgi:hypothetical protein
MRCLFIQNGQRVFIQLLDENEQFNPVLINPFRTKPFLVPASCPRCHVVTFSTALWAFWRLVKVPPLGGSPGGASARRVFP